MSKQGTPLKYYAGELQCCGEYFSPEGAGPFPVVLVVHAWDGLGDEVRSKCRRLTEDGYIGFALDVHGDGTFHTDFESVQEVLQPYMQDRAMLLTRLTAAIDAAANIPRADTARIGTMGYCFGGMCALDLARSGGPAIKAAASFHGLLAANDLGDSTITAPVLVLNGADDPMVPLEAIDAFQQEMSARGADWQLVNYGHTLHGFTRKVANNPERGILYNEKADQRSWRAMLDFFAEAL
ncbi:dienelactone hydrolase family protein [Halioglobus maricola]|uniref:dienelactone hydrolase family protein n=1 Tax=Halioglobus maricola TaxID=2601894 RepID=UPI0014797DA7|nr:dienelactone hydrolase family protein [Halioglobus maricola]